MKEMISGSMMMNSPNTKFWDSLTFEMTHFMIDLVEPLITLTLSVKLENIIKMFGLMVKRKIKLWINSELVMA
jgi:hypothetical protein